MVKTVTLETDSVVWRADAFQSSLNVTANTVYPSPYNKYFTLTREETSGYVSRKPFQKEWKLTRPLILIDMKDMNSRNFILAAADASTRRHIETAFPVRSDGSIYRYSEEDTAASDDVMLEFLCNNRDRLLKESGVRIDGYFSSRQEGDGQAMSFHSEIGLCYDALANLTLASQTKVPVPAKISNNKRRSMTDGDENGPTKRARSLFNTGGKSRRGKRRRSKSRRRSTRRKRLIGT